MAMLLGVIYNEAGAQMGPTSLFEAPDTLCINQPVLLKSNVGDASSFYWGFCSGYLLNNPVTNNLGTTFGFTNPSAIEIAKDGEDYYAFVLTSGADSLFRLAFGNNLGNTPIVTNLGNLSTTVPQSASSLYMIKEDGKYYLFATGGTDAASSSIARFDFGNTLSNTPNSVNFGNLGGVLNAPDGIVIVKEANGTFFGYVVNTATDELIRLSFGGNISLTPITTNLLNPSLSFLNAPNDIAIIKENNNWYFLITNGGDNSLSRLNFGTALSNAPTGVNLGDLGTLDAPNGISIVKDCGSTYAFITNSGNAKLIRVEIPGISSTYTATTLNTLNSPADITRVIRMRDSLFAFVPNALTNGLTAVIFQQCSSSTIRSSTSATPPIYEYQTPGLYNVYLAIDEGLPTAQTLCQQIRALPIPGLTLSPDTLICQGDTVQLIALVSGALSYKWTPNYNISSDSVFLISAYPQYSVGYTVVIPFANGCIIDTTVNVAVGKNHADAGRDRIIADGSATTLGGPYTTVEQSNTYAWTPNQFLDDGFKPFPQARPAYDITYYLTVTDTNGCVDIDTVVLRVDCADVNLPNAFVPGSKSTSGTNKFGLLNRSIIKLSYFRIYDRWGKLVFETTDPSREWDGTYNGEIVPMGVYVWEADGFCTTGRRVQNKGNVTLLR